MSKSPRRRLSIWRPMASQKAILGEESNVLKASPVESSVITNSAEDRIGGERKNRFYRKAILAVPAEEGIRWSRLLMITLCCLLLTVATVHYEWIYLKYIELSEEIPALARIRIFFSQLTLDNFARFMGELGLKVTHLDG